MGYRTQPDGGAKTLAELGLTGTAEEINAAAAAVAGKNAAGGAVILDEEGKVPPANLPASGGGGAFNITAAGRATITGPGPIKFVASDAVTATCLIFVAQEQDAPPGTVKVRDRALSGTKGFNVDTTASLPMEFNWMIIEPA